jgi:hypothetical protein
MNDEKMKTCLREDFNEGMKTYLKQESGKRQCLKRTKWDVDKVWAKRMNSVKLIYLIIGAFE